MKIDRIKVLKDLIEFNRPLSNIQKDLSILGWDSDLKEGAPILTISNLIKIFRKYLNDEISMQDLETWSNMIESREDITFDKENENKINEILFILANPDLEGEINKRSVGNLVSLLEKE